MRRALALVLLAATACTSSGSSGPPKGSVEYCEQQSKNGYVLTTTLRAADGSKESEQRRAPEYRPSGIFDAAAADSTLPRVQVKSTVHQVTNGPRIVTVHPAHAPAWQLKDYVLLTQVGDLLLGRKAGSLLLVAHADGRVVRREQLPTAELYVPLAVTDGDLLTFRIHYDFADRVTETPLLERSSLATGARLWRTVLAREERVAVTGGHLYVLTSAHTESGKSELAVFDAADGRLVWKQRMRLPRADNVRLDGDRLLVDSESLYFGGCH